MGRTARAQVAGVTAEKFVASRSRWLVRLHKVVVLAGGHTPLRAENSHDKFFQSNCCRKMVGIGCQDTSISDDL
jgi:hypothetical protein